MGLGGRYAGTFVGLEGGMLELLGAWRGMPELLRAQGGVCRSFCGLRGGFAGTFVGSRGAMPEQLSARGGVCQNYCGLRGGGMPELLWA